MVHAVYSRQHKPASYLIWKPQSLLFVTACCRTVLPLASGIWVQIPEGIGRRDVKSVGILYYLSVKMV